MTQAVGADADGKLWTEPGLPAVTASDMDKILAVSEAGAWELKDRGRPLYVVSLTQQGETEVYIPSMTATEILQKYAEGYLPIMSAAGSWTGLPFLVFSGFTNTNGNKALFIQTTNVPDLGIIGSVTYTIDDDKNFTEETVIAGGMGVFYVEADDATKVADHSASEIYAKYDLGFIPVLKYDAKLYQASFVSESAVIFTNNMGADEGDGPQLQTSVIMIDDSKAVTDLNGTYDLLPQVTAADSGKFLRVSSSGSWAAESIPDASEVTF